MIRTRAARFLADEDGAVTLDWVALTAATAVVGLLGVNIIGKSTAGAAAEIEATLRAANLGRITLMETSSGPPSAEFGASGELMAP